MEKNTTTSSNSHYLPVDQISGLIKTVTSAPTHIPRKFNEQFVIYQNSTTYRLYIYDALNGAWRYVALT